MKFVKLIIKNVGRNLLRSILTALGTMVLVFVVTLVWSVLSFIDEAMREKSQNLKVIVTERWRIPSQMPIAYAPSLSEGAWRQDGDSKPADSMTWQFYGGTIDLSNRTPDNMIFAFALEPKKLLSMMDELDSLKGAPAAEFAEVVKKLEQNRQGIILGRERAKKLNKRVGERFKIYSINYDEIDLEFEVVGLFPEGRYDPSAAMNRDYLNAAVDAYPNSHANKKHDMADKSLNLVWLRVPNPGEFRQIAGQIGSSPNFSNPSVKCETASSGISTFLEAYRDLLWGMRWLLAPAILITLSLVISNAISISVRERRMELAVLKVLGFKPTQILVLVLGEAIFIGASAGFLSSILTFLLINYYVGGIKFPIAFFPAFMIPVHALWWGAVVGVSTAFLGSFLPAWSARTVKVSDVFSKVT